MSWRNLQAELCEVLSETIEARVPLGSFHPNQSVHVVHGLRTTFRKRGMQAKCRECKRVFHRKTLGMKAIYCSPLCRNRSNRKPLYSLLREVRECRALHQRCPCGKPARAPRRGNGRFPLYCSERCGRRYRQKSRARAGRFDARLCACGKLAKAPSPTGVASQYCGTNCRQRQRAHKERCEQCVFRGALACVRKAPRRKPWSEATMWRKGRPRLTAAQRDEACRMREAGSVLTEIAAHLGISSTHACQITKGAR